MALTEDMDRPEASTRIIYYYVWLPQHLDSMN